VNAPTPYSEPGYARSVVFGILALTVSAAPATAAELAFGAGYAGQYSTNIRQTPDNHENEWINSLVAGAGFQSMTPELQARLFSQVEHRDYLHNVFSDETLFSLDSSAIWVVSPQFFTWTVEDGYQVVLLDATGTDTPSNRAGANAFSTGPDFFLRFSPAHTLTLGGRYGNVYVGRSDLDNDRYTGYARWGYASSPQTTYSLNYESLRVEFDNPVLNANFRREDTFFRFLTRPSRSTFTLDAGGTHIQTERAADVNGALGRAAWTRELTSESTLGLSYAAQYQDTGTALLAEVTNAGATTTTTTATTAQDVVSTDVYYSKQREAFYSHLGSVFGLYLRGYRRDLDFEVTAQDRRETNGLMELSWFYSGADTFVLFRESLKTQFWNTQRQDISRNTGLRYAYRLARYWTMGIEGSQIRRDSSDPAFDFIENRALFSLFYSTGAAYAPSVRR
jgi:hypothetical protein